jgi:hypothetical protein
MAKAFKLYDFKPPLIPNSGFFVELGVNVQKENLQRQHVEERLAGRDISEYHWQIYQLLRIFHNTRLETGCGRA